MKRENLSFNNIENTCLELCTAFIEKFPKLSELLSSATVIDFTVNSNNRYRQFIWQINEEETCGWLCKRSHVIPQELNLLSEHVLLTKTIGGIIKHWGSKEKTFLNSIDFMFGLENCVNGIIWEDHYLENCTEEKKTPIDLSRMLTFSQKTNSESTFYNKDTGEIFYYSHSSYSPFEISLSKDQPEYTIYTYDTITTFADYVEKLAEQWSRNLIG